MATQMLDGIGEIQFRHATAGLFGGGFASVEMTGTTKKAEAKRYSTAGSILISDSRITESTYELKITQETHDLRSFEMALGEQAATSTSVPYYKFVELTVPTTTPYEIPLAEITTALGNASTLNVTLQGNGAWNLTSGSYTKLDLAVIVTGTPTTGQVKMDLTTVGAEKLVFNASQAGAAVIASYQKLAASKITLGLATNPTLLSNFYFSGRIISDEFPNGIMLVCPQVSKTSVFTFKTEDVPKIEHVFTVGTAAGYRNPYHLIEL